MGYFTGPLLERKVEEYDLGILDTKFAAIADGSDNNWPPGGYVVPASPTILEATRIVLYSMLHSYRLKSQFIVRTDYEESVIKVDIKAPARRGTAGYSINTVAKKRIGGAVLASSGYGHTALQDVPEVPEDTSMLFDDNIKLEDEVVTFPAAVGPEKEEEVENA